MRIIGGWLGSRTLQAPPGLATRPTSDRLRETLFNVLAPRMEGAAFLDLYAGSGAVGVEAVSRGAARVVCVERAAPALKVLRANLARLGIEKSVGVFAGAVSAFLRKGTTGAGFDVVFLDPPYDAEGEYAAALGLLGGTAAGFLREGAVVIAEHRRKQKLDENYGLLARRRLLEQGDAALSFYEAAVSS
ncbi:16S rRNA (guanine(966)-N(2))-methyltransferase RsmD [Acidobacteria bacterium AB60]|nr:16S rRNA (guanine(966)-N(2))-methyltransferase RsmD [Acidobacteria bacterium AB60]